VSGIIAENHVGGESPEAKVSETPPITPLTAITIGGRGGVPGLVVMS
jgi:hypothetical protein